MAPKILDASLIPLEKALLARAGALDAAPELDQLDGGRKVLADWLAREFRALAEELRNQ
jgi:hypothetical protein